MTTVHGILVRDSVLSVFFGMFYSQQKYYLLADQVYLGFLHGSHFDKSSPVNGIFLNLPDTNINITVEAFNLY